MRLRALFALILPLAFAACGESSTEPAAVPIESTTFATSLGVNLAASTRTPSGLYYRDIRVGTGATIVSGQALNVKYSGALANGTVFDAGTYAFTIPGNVIQGWNEGLLGMKVGGARQLIIPPSLGYGSRGAGGVIPPNAVLVFTVEPI
ncbi:MAG: FKBP-type peptidyl-prolyl cis-trans isomerase [Gemmatimonadaceae bacterium]|nr:FKBP-type peptidyl-prolyl cis-trans isomerase [Gemmatimonadaceae bacterium]